MRPRKVVVLVAQSEASAGEWKCVLELKGYKVHAFLVMGGVPAAVAFLRGAPLQGPGAVAAVAGQELGPLNAELLTRATPAPLLVFGGKEYLKSNLAAAVVVDGELLAARVLERLKLLGARKRGPKPAAKVPVAAEAVTA